MRSGPPRDEQWFEDLFSRHYSGVLAYVARRAPQEAADVVSEVFTIAWRKRDDIPDHALPWLYGVAAREVLHSQRDSRRRGSLTTRVTGHADAVVLDFTAEIDERIIAHGPVNRALTHLSAADAEVLQLWAWEQLEPNEIATVLGISGVAARVRLHRARKRFETAVSTPNRNPAAPAPPHATTRQLALPRRDLETEVLP